jgi:hypothetical protein
MTRTAMKATGGSSQLKTPSRRRSVTTIARGTRSGVGIAERDRGDRVTNAGMRNNSWKTNIDDIEQRRPQGQQQPNTPVNAAAS